MNRITKTLHINSDYRLRVHYKIISLTLGNIISEESSLILFANVKDIIS